MSALPTHFCSASQTCPNRTNGGPCAEHSNQREKRRINFQWRKQYRQKPWKSLRKEILFDQPFCADCADKGHVTGAQEVHHKVRPTNETQFYDRNNLLALCTPCHARRTARGE